MLLWHLLLNVLGSISERLPYGFVITRYVPCNVTI